MSNRSYPGSSTTVYASELPEDSPARWIPAIPTPLNPYHVAAYRIAKDRLDSLCRIIAEDYIDEQEVSDFLKNQYRFFRQFCEDWNRNYDRQNSFTE